MGMRRSDETCVCWCFLFFFYLLLLLHLLFFLLLAQLLRLLTRLRWADGACEPRCLHQPSPPPGIRRWRWGGGGNKKKNRPTNQPTNVRVPSLLITPTPRMRDVPPRPHPRKVCGALKKRKKRFSPPRRGDSLF